MGGGEDPPVLVGGGGSLGPPVDGVAEIGYSVIPAFLRRGYATEMMAAIVAWTARDPRIRQIKAETSVENLASRRLLARLGFREAGPGRDPASIEYRRRGSRGDGADASLSTGRRARLDLTQAQILAFRRAVNALDERLPAGPDSLRRAAWAGLQDSMPRAALLSIHARVEGTEPSTWEDPSLAQLWGPRFSAYVVAARDVPVFSLGRLPEVDKGRRRADETAARLDAFLDGRRMTYGEAGRGLGQSPNSLRYAAPTGTVLIRWDGARQPTVWTVPPPAIDPAEARLELARRYLHIFGPTTPEAYARWAGIKPPAGRAAFEALTGSLVPVRTPIGSAWILEGDEARFRAPATSPAGARLLPSGDAYFLLQGADRELLVPEADRRGALWTSRVWPGAVLVDGELVGTWRRAHANLTIEPWRRLSLAERAAVEAEAESLPLPGVEARIQVRWVD